MIRVHKGYETLALFILKLKNTYNLFYLYFF